MERSHSRMDGSRFKEEGERLAAEEEKTSEQVPMVRELFAELDEDNSGTLDKGEVRKLLRRLGMRTDTASLNGVMLSMDPDGDGDVTLAEFLAWWRESGTEFKHKMAALAAATAAECDREDAASVLTQRHYRGYRTRHRVMLSELGVHHIYMPPNTRCIHVLQLATILRSPPSARGAAAIRLVESLVTRMEAGQEPKRQFFTTMEPSMRRMLLSHCRIVTFKAAHYVFEQGERSNDTFYFMVSGKTGVVIDGDTKREMHPGATFGEKALAQEADVGLRTAGIIAVTDCIMATLTRADYYRTNGTLEKQVVKVLRLHGDDRTETQVALSKSLFGETEFFQKLHHDAICTQLARACQHVRVKKNELLFRQGEDAETFYIIVQGFVRVVIDGKVALNLGPGMTFGELGVTGVTPAERRRTATIIGGQVPGVVTKQQWGQPADSQSDHMKRSESKVDVCDLAVISREDYLFYTQGTEDAVREVLSLSPNHRTDDHLKLLMNLFAESRFFKQMSSALMQRQVCRSLQMVCTLQSRHSLSRYSSV
jgi:CRP-like cAMP-binding protein